MNESKTATLVDASIELIGAVLIGYFVFGEVPGILIVVGTGCIVVAGLILLQPREK